jgi:hypothetical protein
VYDKEYISLVKECIKNVINQYKCDDCENLFEARFNIDDQLLWETFKLIIRDRTISYSSFKKKERDKRENDLENTLHKLQLGQENNTQELNRVESELNKLREDKIMGIIMRTKAKWSVDGERSTKYFCNLEKRHFTEKVISKLILDNGIKITNEDDILTQQKIFYEALYTSKGTVVSDNHFILLDENNPFIKKLNLEKSEALESELNPEEMFVALKIMKNGKSPGLDGFTTEFYKKFWSDLKYLLLDPLIKHIPEVTCQFPRRKV